MPQLSVLARSLLIVVVILPAVAVAQAPPGVPAPGAPQATPEPTEATPELDRAVVDGLIRILENDAARADLVRQLRTLTEAAPTAADAAAPSGPAPQEEAAAQAGPAPSQAVREALAQARPTAAELLADVEEIARDRWSVLLQTWRQVVNTVERVPSLVAWTRRVIEQPSERAAFGRDALEVAAILALGVALALLVNWSLAGVRARLRAREHEQPLSRVLLAVTILFFRLLSVAAGFLTVSILLFVRQPEEVIRTSVVAGAAAIVIVRVGVIIAQIVLAPTQPSARLVPVSDGTARTLTRATHWLLALFIYPRTIVSILRWQGMPLWLAAAVDRMIALTLLIVLIGLVLRYQRGIGNAIGRLAAATAEDDPWRIPWRRLGSVWHLVAIFFLFSLFAVFMVEGPVFFGQVLMTVTLSFLVLAALVVTLRYVERRSDAFGLSVPEPVADEPDVDEAEGAEVAPRRRRRPVLIVLRLAIALVAVLTVLDVWGIRVWERLFGDDAGLGGRVVDILVVVAVVYAIWWVANRLITRAITDLDQQAVTERSGNRARTLLVLARNAALVTLALIGTLLLLSEIGVNIGPLLAGAGVLGIAIGFGSQRLVQDLISGAFNLVEDTFAVGDVVDLGGKAGVVEAMTIRTVRLRDLGGNVHTIPFSTIDVVTNMTKDFSFAVFDIGVAYREDVDHVIKVIEDLGEQMRREREFRRIILEPMEMFGVDAFGDSAVVVKCRLKVRPAAQWLVSREFRRRLKKRFDELGIEIPFPRQTIYFGEDRRGAASPTRVRFEDPQAEAGLAPQPLPRSAE